MDKPDPKSIDFSHIEYWLKTNNTELYEFLYRNYPNEPKRLVEKMYWYYNNITEHPKCPGCGKPVRFFSFNRGYATFCGHDCAMRSNEVKEKKKQTSLKHYGVESPAQSKEIQEKRKKTCLEKYGVEYAQSSEVVKNKAKKTCLEKYGVEHYTNREKMYNTCQERYGAVSFLTSKDGQKQSKQIKFEKYGDENYTNREKWHETCRERYGVNSAIESPEIRDKILMTNLEKYGVSSPLLLPEFQEKMRTSFIKKYGGDYSIIIDKTRQTNLEKYGVEWACMRPEAKIGHANDSRPNLEFAELLDIHNIEYEREYGILNKSYDFRVGNILIEINPYATHNSTFGVMNCQAKSKTYHMDKSILAEKNGYRCICVWDWDDKDKIIYLVDDRNKIKLYARKCTIKLIKDLNIVNDFLDKYHLQGTCKNQTVNLGLYYEDKLIEIMTFGKPRYNKNVEWELLRLCSHFGYEIVGGSEKLFKYFIEHYSPNSIISYCDLSKFRGDVYNRLGFKRERQVNPSKHWYHPKTKLHITDNLLRQRGFDELFGTNFGKGTNNNELMLQSGFVEIYDCGQATFVWKR